MLKEAVVTKTAMLFKVLGSVPRLRLLRAIADQPRSVSDLAKEVGMSQPMASQHLRCLRQTGLISPFREGRETIYHLVDDHVAHLIDNGLNHAQETHHTAINETEEYL